MMNVDPVPHFVRAARGQSAHRTPNTSDVNGKYGTGASTVARHVVTRQRLAQPVLDEHAVVRLRRVGIERRERQDAKCSQGRSPCRCDVRITTSISVWFELAPTPRIAEVPTTLDCGVSHNCRRPAHGTLCHKRQRKQRLKLAPRRRCASALWHRFTMRVPFARCLRMGTRIRPPLMLHFEPRAYWGMGTALRLRFWESLREAASVLGETA